jgi:hypothetical protein
MTTDARSADRDAHELYIAKVNSLIEQGRERLIANLVAEYEEVEHNTAASTDKAA